MKNFCSIMYIVWFLFGIVYQVSGFCEKQNLTNGSAIKMLNVYKYKCNDGFVSNIPSLDSMYFKCGGDSKWKAVAVLYSENSEYIYLSDVTCQMKVECPDPPDVPKNVDAEVTSRYQHGVKSSRVKIDPPRFYEGDKIKYICSNGYETKEDANGDYYSYNTYGHTYSYDYNVNEEDETPVDEIECLPSGLWNNLGVETLNEKLIKCTVPYESCSNLTLKNGKITSDASPGDYAIKCDQGYHLHVRTDEPCNCYNQQITCAAGMILSCKEDDCTIPSQFDSRLTLSQNKDGIQRYIGGDNVIKSGDDIIFNCSKVTELIYEPFERLYKCRNGKWIAIDKNSWSFGTQCTFPECRKAECDPPCENDGKCYRDNKCMCGELYTGDRCQQDLCPSASDEKLVEQAIKNQRPATQLKRYTCNIDFADFAVLVKIDEIKYSTDLREIIVNAIVTKSIYQGKYDLTDKEIVLIYPMDCRFPEFIRGNEYYIIGKESSKEYEYVLSSSTLIIEKPPPRTMLNSIMKKYERFMGRGCVD